MAKHLLDIQLREETGKEAAKKLRRHGFIPAVLYGHKGNKILSVKAIEFSRIFEEIGEHSIVTINIDGKEETEVIVKDFQLDPVMKNVIHIDFLEFEKGKLLRTEIPIKITGTSKGVKKGGILEAFVRDLEVECMPRNIPDFITLDIEELEIGDSLHVKDIKFDEKIKVLSNPDQVVVTVGMPTKIEERVEEEVEGVPAEAEAEVPAGEEVKKEEAKEALKEGKTE